MSAAELLPCPFCGGTDLIARTHDIDGYIAHIECKGCDDMVGPMSDFKYADEAEAIEDASRVWNRRAPSPAPVSAPSTDGEVKLRAALQLAKDMFIANGLSLPHTMEVIDAALSNPAPGHGEVVPGEIVELIDAVQEWCDAVDRNSSWDGWDHHFKNVKWKVLPRAREAHPATGEQPAPATGKE